MKPQGRKKTRTRVAGHQDCAVCHPDAKSGKARERLVWRKSAFKETLVDQLCNYLSDKE